MVSLISANTAQLKVAFQVKNSFGSHVFGAELSEWNLKSFLITGSKKWKGLWFFLGTTQKHGSSGPIIMQPAAFLGTAKSTISSEVRGKISAGLRFLCNSSHDFKLSVGANLYRFWTPPLMAKTAVSPNICFACLCSRYVKETATGADNTTHLYV